MAMPLYFARLVRVVARLAQGMATLSRSENACSLARISTEGPAALPTRCLLQGLVPDNVRRNALTYATRDRSAAAQTAFWSVEMPAVLADMENGPLTWVPLKRLCLRLAGSFAPARLVIEARGL